MSKVGDWSQESVVSPQAVLLRGSFAGTLARPVKTFRQLYCERHGLADDKFERTLMGRCLHWQAKPFAWLLRWLETDYFAADLDLVRGVGALHRRRDFRNEIFEFQYHPANRGALRRVFGLRVSGARLQRIFEHEMGPADSTPSIPVVSTTKPKRRPAVAAGASGSFFRDYR